MPNNPRLDRIDWLAICPPLKLLRGPREALEPLRLTIGLIWAVGLWILNHTIGGEIPLTLDGLLDQLSNPSWHTIATAIPALLLTMFCAGLISRLGALRHLRGVSATSHDLRHFLRLRGLHLLTSPWQFLVVLCGCTALLHLFAWLASFDSLSIPASLVWGAMLIITLITVIAGLCLLITLPCLPMASAVEGDDVFDAHSRAVSWFIGQPLRLLAMYVLCAIVLALSGGIALWIEQHACALLLDTALSHQNSYGIWLYELNQSDWPTTWSGRFGWLWIQGFHLLFVAYAFSCAWSIWSHGYMILRKSVDGAPPSEIWISDEPINTPSPAAADNDTANNDVTVEPDNDTTEQATTEATETTASPDSTEPPIQS